MTAREPTASPRRITVGLSIADARLAQRLTALLAGDPRLAVAGDDRPDVIVADRGYAPTTPSIVIDEAAHSMDTAEADIRAVLPPTVDAELLRAAIMVVAAGYMIIDADEPHGLADDATSLDQPFAAVDVSLTARERQVLGHIAQGASNKAIARALDISLHTAKFHVASVLVKLGARNRSDAVAIGIRRGLVML